MTYLIDTNVISELRRPNQADRRVLHWFNDVDPAVTYISTVTIAELEQGAAKAERLGRPHALALRRWIDEVVLSTYAGRILPVDEKVALRFGRIQKPSPVGVFDVIIAATAQVHGLTIVTRNVDHLGLFDVPIMNPWSI